MRITGVGSATSVRRNGDPSRKSSSGAGFAPGGATATPASRQAVAAAPLHSMDALLALQSVDDALTGRRKAIKRGEDVLDTLDDLQLDLLTGTISPEKLNRLAALVAERARTGEGAVDGVLDEIELRAQVELAKRGVI